jgi:L-fucose mutarotase
MLKGISPLLGPDLLVTLYRMGHGDEIVLADAHFPGHSLNKLVIRADGLGIDPLLTAILPLFELDKYVADPLVMMAAVPGDAVDLAVADGYRAAIKHFSPDTPEISFVERFAFYERAKTAFAVVMTSDTRKYANIILKKGVTPLPG